MKRNLRLIAGLIVLIVIYAGIRMFSDTSRSKSFRESLVEIDTAKVSKVIISKNDLATTLQRSDNRWTAQQGNGQVVPAEESKVKGALSTLLTVTPSRIVSKSPEKWTEYQLDSAGTRVQVFEGDKNTLDLVIGRFAMKDQRNFHTFVRLYEEPEIYASDNFMGFSLSTQANSYRNNRLASFTRDSLYKAEFKYAENSFSIDKLDKEWFLSDQKLDSASVAKFVSDVSFLSNSNYVDDVDFSSLQPSASIQFKVHGQEEDLVIDGFLHPQKNWVFRSSINPESYFSDSTLTSKLIKMPEDFFSAGE